MSVSGDFSMSALPLLVVHVTNTTTAKMNSLHLQYPLEQRLPSRKTFDCLKLHSLDVTMLFVALNIEPENSKGGDQIYISND